MATIVCIGVGSHGTGGGPGEVAVRLEVNCRIGPGGHRVDEGGYGTSQLIVIQLQRLQFTQTQEVWNRARQAHVVERKTLQVAERAQSRGNLRRFRQISAIHAQP